MRGKWISAGFSIAGAYFGIRFLIFEAAFKLHIEKNLPAHIAFTIAVIGFALAYAVIPAKYKGTAHLIAIIALIGLLLIGMSCCVDSCKKKYEKKNSEQQGAKVEILPPAKSQEKSSSENQGCRVEIPPPGQKHGKTVQKKNQSLYNSWGYKVATSTPKRNY